MEEIYKNILGRLIGAGGIILFLHIMKAIRGSPRMFIEVFNTDIEAREYSKQYFRSKNSVIAPALFTLVFCVGTSLEPLSRRTKIGIDNEWSFIALGVLFIGLSVFLYHIAENYFVRQFLSKMGIPLPNDSRQ